MVTMFKSLRPFYLHYFFPLEPEFPELPELVRGGLFPLPFPDAFPVLLGPFTGVFDFAIILGFYINNGSNIYGMFLVDCKLWTIGY